MPPWPGTRGERVHHDTWGKRMLLRSARMATFAGALVLAGPAVAAHATPEALFGFNGPAIDNRPLEQGTPPYANSQIVAAYRAVRADTVRFTVPWHRLQPRPGPIDWSAAVDPVELELEDAAGMKFLPILSGAPFWANTRNIKCLWNRCQGNIPPDAAHVADYAELVRQFALRYAGRLHGIELWNEPNVPAHFSPDSAPHENAQRRDREAGYPATSAEYARILCAGWDGMRRAAAQNPAAEAPVILGGLSGGPDQLNSSSDSARFLRAVYARMAEMGRTQCFDIVGVHPYQASEPVPASPPQTASGLSDFQIVMHSNRRTIAELDRLDPARPLWITEVGYTTSLTMHTPAQQCRWLAQMADWVRAAPDTGALVIHRFKDLEDFTGAWVQGNYGVLEYGGTPKPAYDALRQQRAGGSWSCPPL